MQAPIFLQTHFFCSSCLLNQILLSLLARKKRVALYYETNAPHNYRSDFFVINWHCDYTDIIP